MRDISAFQTTPALQAQIPASPEVLVQATSWHRNAQGKIELIKPLRGGCGVWGVGCGEKKLAPKRGFKPRPTLSEKILLLQSSDRRKPLLRFCAVSESRLKPQRHLLHLGKPLRTRQWLPLVGGLFPRTCNPTPHTPLWNRLFSKTSQDKSLSLLIYHI